MAIKMFVFYRQPADVEAFMRHYEQVHLPLARKLPHVQEIAVGRITGVPVGEAPWFLVAEVAFADRAGFEAAMASSENAAVAADLSVFAAGLATVLVADMAAVAG